MSHSCIKGEIKKFTNCHILQILRQMWRFQKTKFCASNVRHIHSPKALFIQIFMILHQCHFISAIYLSKLFFKMTTFTVQAAGLYSADHDLAKYNTVRSRCIIHWHCSVLTPVLYRSEFFQNSDHSKIF